MHAYGFSIPALRLAHSYLKNRKQRTKISSACSAWEEILSTTRIFSRAFAFKHISMWLTLYVSHFDFASYADDNTPYVSADTIDEVIKASSCLC